MLKKARDRMVEDRDAHAKVLAAPFDRDKAERARNKFIETQVLVDALDRAISGEEAIEMAERFKPDLVLMDVQLEGAMPGTEASRRAAPSRAAGVVSTTIPGPASIPVAACTRCTATSESAPGATNPPDELSRPASGPPTTPAIRTNSRTATRVRYGCEANMPPSSAAR